MESGERGTIGVPEVREGIVVLRGVGTDEGTRDVGPPPVPEDGL